MTDVIVVEAPEAPPAEPEVIVAPIVVAEPEPPPAEETPPDEPEAPMVTGCCPHCVEHHNRLAMTEARLNEHDQRFTEQVGAIEMRAFTAHDHPPDEDLRIIADELRALREEEVSPKRGPVQRGWLRRFLRGEGR